MRKKWLLKGKNADFQSLAKDNNISTVLARLIVNRGYETSSEVHHYLFDKIEDIPSPWLLKDMDKAVEILLQNREEQIGIASDFDCDGIFAGYILHKGLANIGIRSRLYTPDRIAEGYGLNKRIVDQAKSEGVTLLLTCDNGIAAGAEVEYAIEQGMTVIVTDHHDIQGESPKAHAVIDPKQDDCNYPFEGICGAVVAYKLIQALYEKEGKAPTEVEQFLPFAAMATVTDVMDLSQENRVIVKEGLLRIQNTDNLGLLALMRAQNIVPAQVRAYHIGFIIGPCFNASGRLSTVEDAFQLLMAKDAKEADRLARHLKELNDERKDMTIQGTEQAFERIEKRDWEQEKVLVVYLPGCHESLVGIIAGRVRERYNRPTIVFTDAGEDLVKGSGRSIEAYNMFEELYKCKEMFERFGGHPMAAGITMVKENLELLRTQLNQNTTLVENDLCPVVNIDMAPPLSEVSEYLINQLKLLEPMGKGNTKPVFAGQHFGILRAVKRGKTGNVLSMQIMDRAGTKMDAILFHEVDMFEQFLLEEYGSEQVDLLFHNRPNDIDVAFTFYPDLNEYNGYKTLQVQITGYCRIQS